MQTQTKLCSVHHSAKASFALQIEGRLLPEAARELTRLEEDELLQVPCLMSISPLGEHKYTYKFFSALAEQNACQLSGIPLHGVHHRVQLWRLRLPRHLPHPRCIPHPQPPGVQREQLIFSVMRLTGSFISW